MTKQTLAAALIGDQKPYGYVVEERKPPRFTFQKARPSISDEDMNEGEITIDPVYLYPAEPVQIKQLEWRTFCGTSGNCSAKAFGDEYVVQNEDDRWNMYLPYQDEWCSIHPTLDEAKAAAQANFESRVREAVL